MNIFFLSKTDNLQAELRVSLSREIGRRGNRVAYISSSPQDGERPYYKSTIQDYSAINNDIVIDYFDLSSSFTDEDLAKVINYGTIYLSGGNTYVFLDSVRRRNLLPILKKHAANRGLLIGASAGSIMMTPSIEICGSDEANTPELKDLIGFNFVDFEFHPHYTGEKKETEFLKEYAKENKRTIYACKDGDGIYYTHGNAKLFGEITLFYPSGEYAVNHTIG